MQMKVKTQDGTISASYLRDDSDNAIGIHIGVAGHDSVASLEYANIYGGLALIINHEELDNQKIRLVSRVRIDGRSESDVYDDEPFISKYDRAEFVGSIIDIFEDFLDRKGVNIPNEDKKDSESPAIIYGMDYGELQSAIESMMQHWGVLSADK